MNRMRRFAALFLAFVVMFAGSFGTASLTVSAAKKVNVKSVTVKSGLSGSKKTLYVAKGKSVKLSTTVNVTPDKNANKKVTYKSANSKVASVNAKGVVKGVKAGSTKITVTSKVNKKKKATIKVKVAKVPVTKVKLDKTSASLEKGAGLVLKAVVTAKKGAVKTLAWTSSNEKVATVSSKGEVKAVGAGTATITAKAIDGSGKKAACKVIVSDSVNLTGMKILNSYTISFSLNKACPLSASQVSVKMKDLANGAYRGTGKIAGFSTNNQINYTVILENYVSQGSYVQLSIPSLNGTVKTLEQQYLEPVCAFTDDVVLTGYVGEDFYGYMDHYYGVGYSQSSISGLPQGLRAEQTERGIEIKGTPVKAGVTTAKFTAIDEVGNTFTQNVTFAIGSDDIIAGAAVPRYGLSSNDGSMWIYPRVVGGSGSYRYQIISGQNSGASIDEDNDIYIPLKTPGNYTMVVRVTDTQNVQSFCDIPISVHVAQGISIGGCIKDAQGNPMYGYVQFENKNRADHYFTTGTFWSNSETGVYSALVSPGTYDIKISSSGTSDAVSATHCVQNQIFTASRTGYDFTLPLYKVSLVSSDPAIKDAIGNVEWYIDNEEAGYGSTLYMKPGTYTLESSEKRDYSSSQTTTQGDWFNGMTKTTTYSYVKYRASVKVVNTAVQTAASKTVTGTGQYTCQYPAAKNDDYVLSVDDGHYSLPSVDIWDENDNWVDEACLALKVSIGSQGDYQLTSDNGYSNLYDASGTVVTPAESDDYGYTKTYTDLEAGTYYVGTGNYDDYDSVSISTIQGDMEE